MNTIITNHSLRLLSLFIVLFISCNPVLGQWSTDPAVNNAICDLASEDVMPKVATCPDGSIYIAFFSNVNSYNVRLQKLDSQGNELWQHNGILISDHPTDSWTSDWDMTVDINNHAVLTFSDIRAGGDWQVYAYRISPTGTFAWGPDGIQLSYSGFNAAPKVTCTAAGNAVFAWASDDVIIMQKINPAGVKQWGNNGITLSSANSLSWPQMLPVGTDDIILKYYDDEGNPPYPTRHLLAQRYNASGSPVWSAPTMISDAGGISSWTQILSFINDGSDGFYIAWHDDRDNNMLSSSYIQHVNSSGSPVWTSNGVEICTTAGNNHFYPHLALPTGSSDVFVIWNEMSGNQNQRGISGQKLSSGGARLWGNSGMTFIPLSSTNVYPEAVSSTGTDMMVLYTEGVYQLLGMRIATDGSFVWSPSSIVVSSATSVKVHTVMSDFANNQWIACWEDNRSGVNDIYAQNLSIDGTLGPYEIVYGSIQGHVTLTGGSGNVTQVVVSNGITSTYPDPNGDYFLQSQTGTYTVTASLNGYTPDTVTGVVVIEDQTTNNVDFDLVALPTTGWIEGIVELYDGSGDVTQTIVSAGTVSTNPDINGYYTMEVGVGIWDVTAVLDGYTMQMHSDVAVEPGETTSDIDFLLTLIPTTGFLYGTVTIEGDMADVTQVTITSGSNTVSPDTDGDYILELSVGTHDVIAMHPYTSSVNANVSIEPGASTEQDFMLLMLRSDIIVTCQDQTGTPLNGASIEITGPEGEYTGTVSNDVLVFEDVPYGIYSGESVFGSSHAFADTLIDASNNSMEFIHMISGAKSELFNTLIISPNPVNLNQTIGLNTDMKINGNLLIYDGQARKCGEVRISPENIHNIPVSSLFNSTVAKEGLYIFKIVTNETTYSGKIIIKD